MDEECDEGELNGAEGSFCTETCELLPGCGNGLLEDGEECDDAQYDNPQLCDACLRYSALDGCRILDEELDGHPLAACPESDIGRVMPEMRVRTLPLVAEIGMRFQVQHGVESAPDGSLVFIAYGGDSYALIVRANADGTLRWVTDLSDEAGNGQAFGVEVVDDLVFVGGSNRYVSSGYRRLFATLDDTTGAVVTERREEMGELRDFAREPSGEVLVIARSESLGVSHIDAAGNLTDTVPCSCTTFMEGASQIRLPGEGGSVAWDGATLGDTWGIAGATGTVPAGSGWLVLGVRDEVAFAERYDAPNGPVVASYDVSEHRSLYGAWAGTDGRVYISPYSRDGSGSTTILVFDR